MGERKTLFEPQLQDRQPGIEAEMKPRPRAEDESYRPAGKLLDKVALITGGDSGIGRAVALAFADEGCHSVIGYYNEHQDAEETQRRVEEKGRECIKVAGDLAGEAFCRDLVETAVGRLGRLDILVNNAAIQIERKSVEEISAAELERIFQVNVFSMFYLVKAALKYMKEGSTVINTTSVTAYRGTKHWLDYSVTKGAIVSLTRSLSIYLLDRGIRVNAVAPGPVWTPLVPAASSSPEHVASFGSEVPMGRAAQPEEIAPCYVFLASDDSSYMTGQVLHPNGGEIING